MIFCLNEFSSDGSWFDGNATHKFNGMGRPDDRFIFHTGAQYPTGISPPIRLGLVDATIRGAFMQHDSWGACYVLLDKEKHNNVLVNKLSEGLKIIAPKK